MWLDNTIYNVIENMFEIMVIKNKILYNFLQIKTLFCIGGYHMRIGIDIDNVIADLDKTFLEEFEKEDKNKRIMEL